MHKELEALDGLPNIEPGQTITVEGKTDEEVREYIKSSDLLKKVGCRVIDIGHAVTVVRTQGRVSKMKKKLMEEVQGMHPFQRLEQPECRIQYVRDVLREMNESGKYDWQYQVRDVFGTPEVFIDVFGHDLTQVTEDVLSPSFIQSCKDAQVLLTRAVCAEEQQDQRGRSPIQDSIDELGMVPEEE